MSRRPRIAITPWRRVVPTYLGERTVLDALDPAYSDGVATAGGVPLVVPRPPRGHEAEIAEAALGLADGVLLSGGGDVDPSSYGAADDGGNADVDPAADAWELALVREARRRGLPALGICRGAQIMAVAAGGRLAQSLPKEAEHRDMASLSPEEILAERHPVTVEPGSELERALGATQVEVNTIHHHAIADAGDLRITAHAAGDLIEGVEPADGWPAIGVQWHPEKMREPVQHRLFEWLIRRST